MYKDEIITTKKDAAVVAEMKCLLSSIGLVDGVRLQNMGRLDGYC